MKLKLISGAENMQNITPVNVTMKMAILAHGAALQANLFTVGLLNPAGDLLFTADNEASGMVTFDAVRFEDEGLFHLTAKIISFSADWIIDPTEWPVTVEVTETGNQLHAVVSYPNGVPVFVNKHAGEECKDPFIFPELTFSAAGTYRYTLKELTESGDGWTTDDKVITVIVTVVDDGHGHLVATVHYPEGFPTFTNKYHAHPVKVIICGCKFAIGAPLPKGKFTFGLFDQEGKLISTTTNQ
jgi:pilin isopeptide linkage protein